LDASTEIFLTIVSTGAILLLLLFGILFVLLIYNNRRIEHRTEVRKLKHDFEQEALKIELEIKEQTLSKVSQEIHDNIGQVLSLAKLNLSSIEQANNPALHEKIEGALTLISKSIADLRNLSKTLDPDNISKSGLVSCLKFDLDMIEKTGMYKTSFLMTGDEKNIDSSRQLLLYRITQEAVNNIIKHANARSIDVAICYRDNVVNLSIADDGTGFDTTLYPHKQGAGIDNMKNRMRLMGGEFSMNSTQPNGTVINLTIPLS